MKRSKLVRVYEETYNKMNSFKIDLANIERKPVSTSEVARRAFNIPTIGKTLKDDSFLRRRIRK